VPVQKAIVLIGLRRLSGLAKARQKGLVDHIDPAIFSRLQEMCIDHTHRRHPEVLAATRRASKDRPQAVAAILRDAAQERGPQDDE
jgi:enoyl-CoA hydratase/carnithine racemase